LEPTKSLSAKKVIFERFFESAPDPIVFVNQQGRIVRTNAEVEKKFGSTRKDLTNHPLEILILGRLRKEHVGCRESHNRTPRERPSRSRSPDAAMDQNFLWKISLSPLKMEDEL
jgi:PAS domain S-box-containing protein